MELNFTSFISDANLSVYYRFEGNSTATIGGQNGTDTNITYSTGNGKFGQGAGFNGSDSKIVLSNNSVFKPTANFTVNFWTKNTQASNGLDFLQSWFFDGASVAGWRIFTINSGASLSIQQGKNTGNVQGTDFFSLSGSKVVNDGAWHMCTYTWDGTTATFYVDSVFDASTSTNTMNAVYNASNRVRFGCDNSNGTDTGFYNGALDDLSIFTRALSAGEIKQLYFASRLFGGEI